MNSLVENSVKLNWFNWFWEETGFVERYGIGFDIRIPEKTTR